MADTRTVDEAMAETSHMSVPTRDADDDWIIPTCTCGWSFGPVPDHETEVDVLMGHAFAMGRHVGVKLALKELVLEEEA